MTRIFGGFGSAFCESYLSAAPLSVGRGHAERADLDNLHHVLNHASLFGGGYARRAHALIRVCWPRHATEGIQLGIFSTESVPIDLRQGRPWFRRVLLRYGGKNPCASRTSRTYLLGMREVLPGRRHALW